MAAFLVLCGIALVVDRVFLLPPVAGAEETTRAEPAPASAMSADLDPAPVAAPRDDLASRLQTLAQEHDLRPEEVEDAFEPPAGWPIDRSGSAAGRFRTAHRLHGTFVGARSHAIVDGERLSLGEQIDGFTLVSIGPRSALFRRGNDEVELTLER